MFEIYSNKLRLVILFTASISISFNATAQVAFNEIRIDSFCNILVKNNRLLGQITISLKGKVLYDRALVDDLSDGDNRILISKDSKLRIASITKTFTSALTLMLIEEGKLHLETKLSSFFPKIPNADNITIDNLLSHTSGIRDFDRDSNFDDPNNWIFRFNSKESMLSRISGYPSEFAPGTKTSYSNSNYFLLGCVIEKITGNSYELELKRRILQRLALTNTFIALPNDTTGFETKPYKWDDSKWNEFPRSNTSHLFGAGDIVSTSGDIDRFFTSLYAGKLINQNSLAQMLTLGPDSVMAKDIAIDKNFLGSGKRAFVRLGRTGGYQNAAIFIPEDGLMISCLINGNNYPFGKFLRNIFNGCYGNSVSMPKFSETQPNFSLKKFTGLYKNESLSIRVKKRGSQLLVYFDNQRPFKILSVTESTFIDNETGSIIEFLKRNDKDCLSFYNFMSQFNLCKQ